MQKKSFVKPLSTLLAGALLSMAGVSAMAQTTPVPSNPTTVGVTPQEATEANRKAVPRADTGTVVRTDESAADRARNAANAPANSTPMNGAPVVTTPDNNNAAAVSNTNTTRSTTNQVRRARADRN